MTKQARALGISRGAVYYEPRPVSTRDLALMRRLDELHMEFPFAGARLLRRLLKKHHPLEFPGVGRRNEVWAMDITYIPMAHGFVYLAAVMDWSSRRVLSWRVSITLESALCIDAVEEAIARHGCWRDNIFVERLWRSLKYEEVYLRAYDSVSAAKEGIARYFKLYNTRRPHSSLADRTPDDAYFTPLPLAEAA